MWVGCLLGLWDNVVTVGAGLVVFLFDSDVGCVGAWVCLVLSAIKLRYVLTMG